MMQLLEVSSVGTELAEPASVCATEPDPHPETAIFVGNQMWICRRGTYEARLISTEGEVLGIFDLRDVAAGEVCVSDSLGKPGAAREKAASGVRSQPPAIACRGL